MGQKYPVCRVARHGKHYLTCSAFFRIQFVNQEVIQNFSLISDFNCRLRVSKIISNGKMKKDLQKKLKKKQENNCSFVKLYSKNQY